MSTMTSPRFEMRRLTDSDWLILDGEYDRNDARHTIACVTRVSVEPVEVVWLRPVTHRCWFRTVADVLETVQMGQPRDDQVGGP